MIRTMQATTQTYRDAIERADQHPRPRVLVDWRRNPGGVDAVQNGGFEDGDTHGWDPVPGFTAASVAADDEVAHSGRWSMRVDWAASAGPSAVGITVPAVLGRGYVLRAWVFVPAGSPPVRVGSAADGHQSSTTVDRWELIERTVTSAGAATITVDVSTDGPTTAGQRVWVDDVSLCDFLTPTAVTGVAVDRAIVSDLPTDVTLISGQSVAQANLDLAGQPDDNALDAASIYSAFNGSVSEFADFVAEDVPVSVQLGLRTAQGDELYPVLSGVGRDLSAVAEQQTASLEVLDLSERLRIPARLPLTVGRDATNAAIDGAPGAGLNSQWVSDALARQGGFFASAPPRPDCVMSATLHGCLQADVGELFGVGAFLRFTSPSTTEFADPRYEQGKYALAPTPGEPEIYTASYNLSRPVTMWADSDITLSGWIFVPDTPVQDPSTVDDYTWQVSTQDGSWLVSLTGLNFGVDEVAGTLLALSVIGDNADLLLVSGDHVLSPGWNYIGGHVKFGSSSVDGEVVVNGITTLTGTEPVTPAVIAAAQPMPLGGVLGSLPAEAVQADTHPAPIGGVAWDHRHRPTAVLEAGIELTAIPALSSDATCWSVLQDIAAAQAGVVHIDERAVLQIWGRRHWRTAPAATQVQRTLTATTSLKQATVSRLADRVRNHVRVAVSPLQITGPELLWQESEALSVPAGGTITRIAHVDQGQAFEVRTDTAVIPAGGFDGGFRKSGYRASFAPDGSGGEAQNLTMTVRPLTDAIVVTLSNPNARRVWIVSPKGVGYPSTSDGQPSLIIVGRRITTQATSLDGTSSVDSTSVTVARRWEPSIAEFGERILPIDANPWMQVTDEGDALAWDLLHDTAWPMPYLSSVDIVGDPSVMLGDRVHLVDTSNVTGVDDPFWIVGYRIELTGGDDATMAMSLTVRPVAPPGAWILGVAGRSELGITTRL